MKLKAILAGTAIATFALTAAPHLGAPSFTTQAEAAVNVSVGIFYDRLGSYGDWVSYNDQYVFIPTGVHGNWRPYTEGHWVYTRRYGWTWASDEPFGWATYHYGRWGYSNDVGWYWVPGQRWAPAWVSWRRSNDYVVWAPLPPDRRPGVDISIDINANDIPDYYWVAVPTRRFLAPDLRVDIINNDSQIRNVVGRTEYIGTPHITNNIVVNNNIDVNVISRETGQQVRPVEVRTTDNPVNAKATASEVTVFQGQLTADTKAKPQKLTDVTQVKKIKRNQAGNGGATTDQNATGATPVDNSKTNAGATTGTGQQPATQAQDQQPSKKGKKLQNQNASTPDASGQQPSAQAQDQQNGKKRKKLQDQNASTPDASGQQPATQAQDQQTGKKRKKLQDQNASTPDASGQQPATQAQDQQSGNKRKKLQPGADQATGSTSQAPAVQGNGRKAKGQQQPPDANANAPAMGNNGNGKGKKQMTCDPNTDANCAPAQ